MLWERKGSYDEENGLFFLKGYLTFSQVGCITGFVSAL